MDLQDWKEFKDRYLKVWFDELNHLTLEEWQEFNKQVIRPWKGFDGWRVDRACAIDQDLGEAQ